ncbi:trypsin-like peptidase domain-containing protein [Candidatus Pacearchaeota archaeon]|nr:trypsin-like peptidase domain-containing protein [Candidatus Pacearchaeota archaeon]
MALKKHHKIILGSFSSLVIIFMIVSSIFLYLIFLKQDLNHRTLNQKITENQNNINSLAENLIQTKLTLEETVGSLDIKLGSIDKEVDLLKASTDEDFSGIIEDLIKSVVTITTNSGQGTGFIISEEGYLVTNAHVLADESGNLASTIRAITYEKEILKASFIGYDGNLDVALLKISGDYIPVDIADSDLIQIGEKVIAIGNPLGLQFSVSEGIVSATHRKGPSGLEAYIQTDAALNPGNSGGPLINKQGEVIGINNFKIGSGESLGFALESNYVKETVNTISRQKIGEDLI